MFKPIIKDTPIPLKGKVASADPGVDFQALQAIYEAERGKTPQTFSEALSESVRPADDLLTRMRRMQRQGDFSV